MTQKAAEQEVELTNRIQEMIEGESPEVLKEILNLIKYHCGYRAGAFNGEAKVKAVIKDWKVKQS